MLGYPLVTKVVPKDDLMLAVYFNNGVIKHYDCKQLLNDDVYKDLLNNSLFNLVQVDCGGYAICWNEYIDLPESELWDNGTEI